jgi:hypothetical protein
MFYLNTSRSYVRTVWNKTGAPAASHFFPPISAKEAA